MDDQELFESDERLLSHVGRLVDYCENKLNTQAKDRKLAIEYYNGVLRDLKAEEGQSSIPSKDLRMMVKKQVPAVMRALFSADQVVRYEPRGPGDAEMAEQATAYVNKVVLPACGARKAIYDAIFDAFLVKTGILRWSAYKDRKADIVEYTDLPDEAVIGLLDDPGAEIMDHEVSPETDPGVLALDPDARRHSFRLKRVSETTRIMLEAVPRDDFLIWPDADSIEEAPIVGERQEMTRSDLVAMGYDREQVYSIARKTGSVLGDDDRAEREGDDYTEDTGAGEVSKSMELCTIYDIYAMLDEDGDGIAEMHHIVYGDGEGSASDPARTSRVMLKREIVSEAPYADVVAERDPHSFEGRSLYEDLRDIMRVKTSFLRGIIDNANWSANPTAIVDLSAVEREEDVVNPRFGQPILLKEGKQPSDVVNWMSTPFVAKEIFGMLPYFDEMAAERTGITDASGGADPEQFAHMTATTAQIMTERGVAQSDMLIRNLAQGGLRKAFRGILKLVIAHADRPRELDLTGKLAVYDPATWNVDLDCTINVGLGAGSRERDMQAMQFVWGKQLEVVQHLGPGNPLVGLKEIAHTLVKMTESTGLPSAEPHFRMPSDEEIAAFEQQMAAKAEAAANAAMMEKQAEMELKRQETEGKLQIEQAQAMADIAVREHEQETRLDEVKIQEASKQAMHREELMLDAAKSGLPVPPEDPGYDETLAGVELEGDSANG